MQGMYQGAGTILRTVLAQSWLPGRQAISTAWRLACLLIVVEDWEQQGLDTRERVLESLLRGRCRAVAAVLAEMVAWLAHRHRKCLRWQERR